MINYALIGISAIIFFVHTGFRFIDSLHMFQQNIYDTKRYFTWCAKNTDKVLPFVDILPLVLWLMLYFYPSMRTVQILLGIMIIFYLIKGLILYRSRKGFVKLPLVLTPRAQRLIITSTIIIAAMFVAGYFIGSQTVTKLGNIFVFQTYILVNLFIYLIVWLANMLNYPIERSIRKHFIKEAQTKMEQLSSHLDVIGITGSYGKTTTKNIVTHIINQEKYALMTPASFNTPMGLTMTIRGKLKPIHEVFVAEMGAYKVGEIKELADLVSPKYGILTAIGPQHLNTFKTIENVQKTKFELIEALTSEGVAVLNIDEPLIKSYTIASPCKKITYSLEDANADFFAKDIVYSNTGIDFVVVFPDKTAHAFSTPLLGEHNIQNIMAGIAVANDMGIAVEKMQIGVATLPQVEHRLELKKAGNYTIIDDAFNANPVGTKKAIDVLEKMNGKRIVLTPGMIELGSEEARLNKEYGEYMADKVDFVILVGKQQTLPIYEGLKTKMTDEHIYVADNLQDAFVKMHEQAITNSYVLIANDLPDIYNE